MIFIFDDCDFQFSGLPYGVFWNLQSDQVNSGKVATLRNFAETNENWELRTLTTENWKLKTENWATDWLSVRSFVRSFVRSSPSVRWSLVAPHSLTVYGILISKHSISNFQFLNCTLIFCPNIPVLHFKYRDQYALTTSVHTLKCNLMVLRVHALSRTSGSRCAALFPIPRISRISRKSEIGAPLPEVLRSGKLETSRRQK